MASSLLLALGASTRIDIIAKYTGLKTLPSLAFSIPKNSLWIVKVVSHTCTVVFCRFMVCYIWRVEKEKSERDQKWQFNVEILTLFDVKMI